MILPEERSETVHITTNESVSNAASAACMHTSSESSKLSVTAGNATASLSAITGKVMGSAFSMYFAIYNFLSGAPSGVSFLSIYRFSEKRIDFSILYYIITYFFKKCYIFNNNFKFVKKSFPKLSEARIKGFLKMYFCTVLLRIAMQEERKVFLRFFALKANLKDEKNS